MKLLIGILFYLFSVSLYSQNFNKDKLDSLFMLLNQYDRGMGSVSIFQDGQEVYRNSIGYIDLEKKLKANDSSIYRIGSISKTFTATLIMQLVEQDLLALDQPLSDFFPQIPNAEEITLENLLRHQSGIFNLTADEEYLNFNTNDFSKKELLEKIAGYESKFEPGSKNEYSNSNYVLLSFIAEEVSGKSFPQLLEDQIVKACELKHTAYGDKIESTKNEAHSYEASASWIKSTETDLSIPQGAGGIVSTPTDLNTFLNCLFGGELVSTTNLENMMKLEHNYGLGIFTVPFYDRTAYGHTGGIDAFLSNAFYFPKDKVAVSYTSNAQRTPINNIMIGVLSIYFGKEYTLPEFKEMVTLTSEDLEPYVGIYSGGGFPLKLTITKEDNVLYCQATAQPRFALEPLGNHQFQFEQAGLKMTFQSEDNLMIFEQMGGRYELKKN